jgi:hypothetical protein
LFPDEILVEYLLREDYFAVVAETLHANAVEIFVFDLEQSLF